LKLFNVAEAARQLGVDSQQLYRDIWAKRVPEPKVCLGRRHYFTQYDLCNLATQYEKGIKR
jgi:hypothetical protein